MTNTTKILETSAKVSRPKNGSKPEKTNGIASMMIVVFLIGAVLGYLVGYCWGFKDQEKVDHSKQS